MARNEPGEVHARMKFALPHHFRIFVLLSAVLVNEAKLSPMSENKDLLPVHSHKLYHIFPRLYRVSGSGPGSMALMSPVPIRIPGENGEYWQELCHFLPDVAGS